MAKKPDIREFRVTINMNKDLGEQILIWWGKVPWQILEELTGFSRQHLTNLANAARERLREGKSS